MTLKPFLPAVGFALYCFAAPAGYCGGDAADPGAVREFGAATLAEVDPGRTTKAQVEALLGQPWRTIVSDPDESDPEVWEYRGRDANGTYLLHIEFDDHDITTLIAQIPDKAWEATARVAKSPSGSSEPEKRD
jgi:hypothetical protein